MSYSFVFIRKANGMSSNVISRIFLLADGSVHIGMRNNHTIFCTGERVMDLFSDPCGFLQQVHQERAYSTRNVNPKGMDVGSLPGLTLAEVYEDTKVVVYFSVVFELLNSSAKDKPWNLKKYLYKKDFKEQNQYFIKIFLDMAGRPVEELHLKDELKISPERQEQVMREIINASLASVRPETPVKEKKRDLLQSLVRATEFVETPAVIPAPEPNEERWLNKREYAAMIGVMPGTVQMWLNEQRLPMSEKRNGVWYISSKQEKPGSGRKKGVSRTRKVHSINTLPYKELQEYIKETGILTDNVRQFIRTGTELKYYMQNGYCEVRWDGQPALIVDINPDYYSKSKQMTNRELCKKGQAPVFPPRNEGDEECFYDIHHIGQKPDSAFAIIPSCDHNGKEMYSVFHDNASSDKELHTKEFAILKKVFWKNYIEMYDKYGSFRNIPSTNLKKKK